MSIDADWYERGLNPETERMMMRKHERRVAMLSALASADPPKNEPADDLVIDALVRLPDNRKKTRKERVRAEAARRNDHDEAEAGFGFRWPGKSHPPHRYRDTGIRKGPNRNRRCPCGSMLKFKHCCIDA